MVEEATLQAGAAAPEANAASAPHSAAGEPVLPLPRVFLLGLAALGAGIGLFVGLSRTPVVGDLLPLLFALIATGGGVYAAYSGGTPQRLHNLGRSLLAFVPACACFAVLGALTRAATAGCLTLLGYSLCAGAPALVGTPQALDEILKLELRAYLQVFGASPAEQSAIVGAYFRSLDETTLTSQVRERAASLLEAVEKLRQILEATSNLEVGPLGPATTAAGEYSLLLQEMLAVLTPQARLRDIPAIRVYAEAIARFDAPSHDTVRRLPGLGSALQGVHIHRRALLAALAAAPELLLLDLAQRADQAKKAWPVGFRAEAPEATGVALERRNLGKRQNEEVKR